MISAQELASRFQSQLIRASAGTGKTFTLTNRFLSLLLTGESPDKILATTFTRKAAGEILERVFRRLAKAASSTEEAKQLSSELAMKVSQELCGEKLVSLLQAQHRLRICTLDSFFIQIALSFSLELGVVPGWRIIDQGFDRQLRDEALRATLSALDLTESTRLFRAMRGETLSREVHESLARQLYHLYELYRATVVRRGGDRAWGSFAWPLRPEPYRLDQLLEEILAAELPKTKKGEPTKNWLRRRQSDVQNARAGIWRELDKGIFNAVLNDDTFDKHPPPAEIVRLYRELSCYAEYSLGARARDLTEATRELLERFDHEYRRVKAGAAALLFDDIKFILSSASVLGTLDELFCRLDGAIHHLLLDEFQDTSRDDWGVLKPIVEEVLSKSDGTHSLLCVGDVKQAIYGWRGGETAIFDEVERHEGVVLTPLSKSFRSSPEVIDAVNRVFLDLESNRALAEFPHAAREWRRGFEKHSTARDSYKGYVRLEVAAEVEEGEKSSRSALRCAADRVAELHARHPQISIAVLVRRNASVAPLIFELRLRGIVASDEGGNPLTDSPAVAVVLALLQLADHPGDSRAAWMIARSPLGDIVGLSAAQVHQEGVVAGLAQQLRAELREKGFARVISELTTRIAVACNTRDVTRLRQLAELALRYSPRRANRISEFLEFVRETRVEDPSSAKVRVMTIHRSKGLQFDVVILPELDDGLSARWSDEEIVLERPGPLEPPSKVVRVRGSSLYQLNTPLREMRAQWCNRQVQEALSLLYVALTRAVHGLYMIVQPKASTGALSFASIVSAALAPEAERAAGSVLAELGDINWKPQGSCEVAAIAVHAAPPLEIVFAASPLERSRRLLRRAPSELEGGEALSIASLLRIPDRAAMRRGSMIHRLFESVEWLASDRGIGSDQRSLSELVRADCESDTECAAIVDQFLGMLRMPATAALLKRPCDAERLEVMREQAFAFREESVLYSGAIDRVVVRYAAGRPESALIVDFKTDRVHESEGIEARARYYGPQIDVYKRAVTLLTGLKPEQIGAQLAFVSHGEVRSA